MKRIHSKATGLLLALASLGAPLYAQAAEPTTRACLAANESAIALRRESKLSAARAELLVCAAPSCPLDIRRECTRGIDELNLAIPTVVFEAKDSQGNDLSAVRVSVDGKLLTERLDGSAIALDPGSHAFRFEAEGLVPVEKTLVIRRGEKDRREPVSLEVIPSAGTSSRAPQALEPAPIAAQIDGSESARPAPKRVNPLRVAGLAAGGVGIIALGVGGVFGLKAKSKRDDSNSDTDPNLCDSTDLCGENGLALRQDALRAGRVSTVLFVTGGVLAVGGATLYFVSKPSSKESTAARVGVTPLFASEAGGLLVHGAF